jgi:hypothetical protein
MPRHVRRAHIYQINYGLNTLGLVRPKKNTCGSGSRPTLFFLPTLLLFQRDWPCDPIFSGWLQAAHTACQNGVCCHTNYWTKLPKFVHRKYASLVYIDVGTLLQIAKQKTANNNKKNNFISDLPTPIFHDMKPEPQVFFLGLRPCGTSKKLST